MITNQLLIQFLRDNKELLMDKDFQTLYDKLPADMHPNLTEFLYNAKINPLNYNLWYIPERFAFSLNINNASSFPNELIIPEGIERIDNSAFNICYPLQSVIIPDSTIVIKMKAFSNCPNLEKVKIGKGLIYLNYLAFYNCKNLKKINLPKSLKYIESMVFDKCINLKEIDYEGTVSEWEQINISMNNNIGLFSCDIQCIDDVYRFD